MVASLVNKLSYLIVRRSFGFLRKTTYSFDKRPLKMTICDRFMIRIEMLHEHFDHIFLPEKICGNGDTELKRGKSPTLFVRYPGVLLSTYRIS